MDDEYPKEGQQPRFSGLHMLETSDCQSSGSLGTDMPPPPFLHLLFMVSFIARQLREIVDETPVNGEGHSRPCVRYKARTPSSLPALPLSE